MYIHYFLACDQRFVNEKAHEKTDLFTCRQWTLRPEPILMLRSMAKKLELETSFEVISMGLLHSNKVNQELLNGIAGQTIDT